MAKEPVRCVWCARSPIETEYHDTEWGVPLHDDRKLFEFIVLDAAQAGLSWLTVLKKREGYRKAFENFDAEKIARYDKRDIERLLTDNAIIRNRLKVESAVLNARKFLELQSSFGSFDKYIWQFTGGKTLVHRYKLQTEVPPRSKESDAMSVDLKHRGFKFVGSTICYAFMQAAGMVNDHLVSCFRHKQCGEEGMKTAG